MNKLFKINEKDNVAVALEALHAGYSENEITLLNDVPFGHKVLLSDLKAGDEVIKYGFPIGRISEDTPKGGYVHSHNLKTGLSESNSVYSHLGKYSAYHYFPSDLTFMGYNRENGEVGIRNDIWIIPTVGCVNKLCERLCGEAQKIIGSGCTGVKAFTHPYGCSQMGGDQQNTQKVLASLVNHPNAGGVLVVSLGCENNNLDVFRPLLGNVNENRVKFLVAQDETDEFEAGKRLLAELSEYVNGFKRAPVSIDKLIIGYKCGGSDAFSGITANALCGRLTDKITSLGAGAVLTEVPEMFGAETILMGRTVSEKVFKDTVDLICGFKQYFISHNQTVYENPSPGNKAGGITTLEEKSLGCIQKGGSAAVTAVIPYGEHCKSKGLNLLTGPGNDIVSTTNLTAAGAHMILFTTGRGTPLGAPVPTIKISSNTPLYNKKRNWIDFNAGELINGSSFDKETERLFRLVLDVASGKETRNEINGYSEIAIFKDGVTM